MNLDDAIRRLREATLDQGSTSSVLVYTTGSKEFFAGEIVDLSADGLLLRQADGTDVLILQPHIVAISAAAT